MLGALASGFMSSPTLTDQVNHRLQALTGAGLNRVLAC